MSDVNAEIKMQGNDNAFFTTNAAVVYPANIQIFHTNGRYKFTDGVTALSALSFLGGSTLGLIQIIDLDGDFFTDLATASAYISTVTSATITNESYSDGVYYFTVPQNTSFDLGPLFFLGFSPTNASIIDEIGLITSLVVSFGFYKNHGNHKLGNVAFVGNEFDSFSGTIEVQSIVDLSLPSDSFADNSTGKFIIKGNIGATPSGNSYSPFFLNSTATILVNKEQYTINSGGIQGDLVTAITNGCNVFFDGIDKEDKRNKSTSVITDKTSNIKYPSVKSVFDWITALFATKGSVQNYYSGKRVTIPFAGTSSAINGWNGAIIYIPIPITSSVAFIGISQEVTALSVGANIRLALYTSVNGLPASLLEDSGNISTSTAGIKNYVLSAPYSFTAVDKQVFVAIQSSNVGVGLRYALNTVCFNYFNGSGQSGSLFYQVQVFGAFPATATPSVYANANSPLVSLLVQ